MVLESSAKLSQGCQLGSPGLVGQKVQEPLTQGAKLLGNNFVNTGNVDKYFTESSSEGSNKQFFLNLPIQLWAGLIEQIQEKLT